MKRSRRGKLYELSPSVEIRKRISSGTLSEVYQLLCANCHAIKSYENRDYSTTPESTDKKDESLPLFDLKSNLFQEEE
jgi:hypothetical protein